MDQNRVFTSQEEEDTFWDIQDTFWDRTDFCENCESITYGEDIINGVCPVCGSQND